MALTAAQFNALMGGLNFKTRAELAGVKPEGKDESRLFKHIEAQATSVVAEPTQRTRPGLISFDNAPKTRAESGLLADGFVFDASQVYALNKLIRGRHVCLIGAAGTGKTTMVKHALGTLIYDGDPENGIEPIGIRRLSGDQGPSIAICAFTGIATQVVRAMLPEWLGPACKTIHGLLEYKPANGAEGMNGKRAMFIPTRTANNKLDIDLLIIDEASMLGLDLWHNVIDALRPGTRVILIGDLNQLKPVADATMFAYALSAGIDQKHGWDIAELTTIHRQKEAAANKIIEGAHAILNGKQPVFDDPQKDPNWRFIGFELKSSADKAHQGVVGAINLLRTIPTPGEPDRKVFDPYKDLLLCAGNGYDENDSASLVQQAPLNNTLSRLIEKPSTEHPIYIIDAGRETRRFAVNHRVMATKNESMDQKDRVTNGLVGQITEILPNSNWNGNKSMFGTESEVDAFRKEQVRIMMAQGHSVNKLGVNLSAFELSATDTESFTADDQTEERQASHVVSVRYANGAERTYRTAVDVGGLMLAYAITVHKAQGSQADTVVIVVHHAVKRQLSREWLYTGVTRARRRVVVLYTPMGLAKAIAHQQIFGDSLRTKINRYRQVMEAGNTFVRLEARQNVLEGSVDRFDDEESAA